MCLHSGHSDSVHKTWKSLPSWSLHSVCVCGGRKQKISKCKAISTLENEGRGGRLGAQAVVGGVCSLNKYSEQASQRRTEEGRGGAQTYRMWGNPVALWGKSLLEREEHQCKGPTGRKCLRCVRNSQVAITVEVGWAGQRRRKQVQVRTFVCWVERAVCVELKQSNGRHEWCLQRTSLALWEAG